MSANKLRPYGDPRFTHEYATVNGRRYHYLLALPPGGAYTHTVFLIHGWPDLSLGWRYQVPLFLNLGCRVVCPDKMGFGRTEAPHVPPEAQNLYGLKRCADDIAALAGQLGAGRIILGGHDWGGAVAWRVLLWHPQLVSHAFVVCTPYARPRRRGSFSKLEDVVRHKMPFWAYQLQLASGEVERRLTTRPQLERFVNGMYGGKTPDGQPIFSVYKGLLWDNVDRIGRAPLLDDDESRYYTDEYYRNGLAGTVNWYRTSESNYEDELALDRVNIDVPVLFVQANRDEALPPAMSAGMEDFIPQLRKREVDGGHWCLWQKPEECNEHILSWLDDTQALAAKSSL